MDRATSRPPPLVVPQVIGALMEGGWLWILSLINQDITAVGFNSTPCYPTRLAGERGVWTDDQRDVLLEKSEESGIKMVGPGISIGFGQAFSLTLSLFSQEVELPYVVDRRESFGISTPAHVSRFEVP